MSIREEILERLAQKMYMAHPKRLPPIIKNALNGRLALQHPQSYKKVPHNPGHNPGILGRIRGILRPTPTPTSAAEKARLRRSIARTMALQEETQLNFELMKKNLLGPHTLSSSELGQTVVPSSIVTAQTLRTGNHTGPGRMGHDRPEPSVRPRARHPEAVNTVAWEFKEAAYVAPKSLSKGSVNQRTVYTSGQGSVDGKYKRPSKTN